MKLAIVVWLIFTFVTINERSLAQTQQLTRENISGSWEVHISSDNGFTMSQLWRLDPDGRFWLTSIINRKNEYSVSKTEGTWSISDRIVEFIIQKSDDPRLKPGHKEKNTVLFINDNTITTRGQSGSIVTGIRVSQPENPRSKTEWNH